MISMSRELAPNSLNFTTMASGQIFGCSRRTRSQPSMTSIICAWVVLYSRPMVMARRIRSRAAKVSRRCSERLPLGRLITVRSRVRKRVERIPISSTVPTKSSTLTKSPTRKGWSTAREMEPKRFSTVFWAPKAKARPPMPRPARRVVTGYPKAESTASAPTPATMPLEMFEPIRRRLRAEGLAAAHGDASRMSRKTSIERHRAQKTTTTTPAVTASRNSPSACAVRLSDGRPAEKTASPQANVRGGPIRRSSLSSQVFSVRAKSRPRRDLVSPPSRRPSAQAARSSSGRAIHCHRARTPTGPGRSSALGQALADPAVVQLVVPAVDARDGVGREGPEATRRRRSAGPCRRAACGPGRPGPRPPSRRRGTGRRPRCPRTPARSARDRTTRTCRGRP